MKKKLLSCLLVVGVTICFISSTPFAGESQTKKGELNLEEITANEQLMEVINEYLNSKLDSLSDEAVAKEINLSDVQQNKISRSEGFYSLEDRSGLEFKNVEISAAVKQILAQNEEELRLQVYEWTTIYYKASPDAEIEDIMGYGVDHEMTLALNNGEYEIIKDSFDERFMTGVCSTDFVSAVETKELDNFFLENNLGISTEQSVVRADDPSYDVNLAINYANQYCGIATRDYTNSLGVPTPGNNFPLYNLRYIYYSGRDCANFVSQCLSAGGLEEDGQWYAGKDEDKENQSEAWCNAKRLEDYLTNTKDIPWANVSAGGANVYPGNPVYWINPEGSSSSGHQMICTGYNSMGNPVLNGHNDDMFRVPYHIVASRVPNNGAVLRTVFIKNTDQHVHEYDHSEVCQNSDTGHYYRCDICRRNSSNYAHRMSYYSNSTYHWMICSECEYRTENLLHDWIYIDGVGYRCRVCWRAK